MRATVLAIALAATGLTAQDARALDTQVEQPLPDLAVTENDLADERKYFILHKPGITPAQAEADLSFCWQFLPRGAQRQSPDFIAWQGGDLSKRAVGTSYSYGLVGAAIGALVAGPIERSLRQSRIFRCMVPRGYARYRTSEAIWRQLNEGDPKALIALQARIAAGPVPPTAQVLR